MSGRHGLGDPRIPWTILLRADGLGHPVDPPGAAEGSIADLLPRLAARRPDPVAYGRDGDSVVIAADHTRLDGLALLTVLEQLLDAPVRSSAAGVPQDRASTSLLRAALRRTGELLVHPPAVPAPSGGTGKDAADTFVSGQIARKVATSDLVAAGARAVARWNRDQGRPARQVTVAVGVSTLGGAAATIGDHSAYLRLTHGEQMGVEEVRTAIAQAPLQPGGSRASAGPADRVAGVVTAALAGRLGSSLLVSHLGEVATESCTDLTFFPVTGGASGVALGAVGLAGHTTISLRARGSRYSEDGLHALLETVLDELGATSAPTPAGDNPDAGGNQTDQHHQPRHHPGGEP